MHAFSALSPARNHLTHAQFKIKRVIPINTRIKFFAVTNELKAEARARGGDIIDFGMGNPEQGGLPIDEFTRRQALHRQAEVNTMLDVPKFIEKSKQQGFNHFINDAGGSLCELDDDKVYQTLAEHTLILYIRASKTNESALIERAQTHPKPLYYQAEFLKAQLEVYLAENGLTYAAQINPDAFVGWIFPRLLAHRIPKYEAIADKYGYTIDSEDLYQCKNADEMCELIHGALD